MLMKSNITRVKAITITAGFLLFGGSAAIWAQDAATRTALEAPVDVRAALEAIEADTVELLRIADYQDELIALAREDLPAAVSARRAQSSCGTREQVEALCGALRFSYPKYLRAASEPLEQDDK